MREGFVWSTSVEQPRCDNCGHRRVYHRIWLSGTRPEIVTPCSLDRCGCLHYQPSNVRIISG